jgi:ribose 5-phosphate isomerase B
MADGARKWADANVLALSLRLTSAPLLAEMLDAWFAGEPSADPVDAANVAHVGEIEKTQSTESTGNAGNAGNAEKAEKAEKAALS